MAKVVAESNPPLNNTTAEFKPYSKFTLPGEMLTRTIATDYHNDGKISFQRPDSNRNGVGLTAPVTAWMMKGPGEMAEWLKAPVSKTGSCASATWVRIPLSPFGQANDRPSFVMSSDEYD